MGFSRQGYWSGLPLPCFELDSNGLRHKIQNLQRALLCYTEEKQRLCWHDVGWGVGGLRLSTMYGALGNGGTGASRGGVGRTEQGGDGGRQGPERAEPRRPQGGLGA